MESAARGRDPGAAASGGTARNRGPAAAASNRAALLRAARRLFAERGPDVPLSAIAQDAGVGQGSLYRHFPTRHHLAEAIFDENMAELAAVAADAGPDGFAELWGRTVDALVAWGGFAEVAVGARQAERIEARGAALGATLAEPLARAQASGRVASDLGVADLLLVLGMVVGAMPPAADPTTRRRAAHRALALVGRGLEPA